MPEQFVKDFGDLTVDTSIPGRKRLLVAIDPADIIHVQGGSGGLAVPVGLGLSMEAHFTRPHNTTPYAAGDIVSNGVTAPMTFADFARTPGGTGYIVKVRLETNVKAVTPRIRVHLFKDVVGITWSADNDLHLEAWADRLKRITYIDLPAMTSAAHGSTEISRADVSTCRVFFSTLTTQRHLYVVLETLDIWTPANDQEFSLMLSGDLN